MQRSIRPMHQRPARTSDGRFKETTYKKLSTYQRKLELMKMKGNKSIIICPKCEEYCKKTATSNFCGKCRKLL